MTTDDTTSGPSPSELLDQRIEDLGDWRGDVLRDVRAVIHAALPEVVEEWKWRGVPVWYCEGMVCTGEAYKAAVKMTFANGAALDDPSGLFNASLEGNVRRAIDIHEGDSVDARALTDLLQAAAAYNVAKKASKKKR